VLFVVHVVTVGRKLHSVLEPYRRELHAVTGDVGDTDRLRQPYL